MTKSRPVKSSEAEPQAPEPRNVDLGAATAGAAERRSAFARSEEVVPAGDAATPGRKRGHPKRDPLPAEAPAVRLAAPPEPVPAAPSPVVAPLAATSSTPPDCLPPPCLPPDRPPPNLRPPDGPDPADLLAWYDRHARALPWRAKRGEAPDPYRVWLSEIMLQQTTVAAVRPYFAAFLDRFPTLPDLAAAPSEQVMSAWAGLGYYSRARNLHACAQAIVARHGGRFPDTEEGLRRLPGIGAYTSAAVAAIAFGRSAAAVDGNVERVLSRVYAIAEPLPASRPRIRTLTVALVPSDRPGDFAQALMDLGATLCTPKRPACALCPWMRPCLARAAGLQDTFPRKVPKREGVLRRGAAFVALRDDDALLLRTREPTGLLGGMAEPPSSDWLPDYDPAKAVLDAPLDARWRRLDGTVRHVFTHFPLELTVFLARVARGTPAPEGARWTPRGALADEPLPNVMKKVLAHALGGGPVPAGSAGRPRKGGP